MINPRFISHKKYESVERAGAVVQSYIIQSSNGSKEFLVAFPMKSNVQELSKSSRVTLILCFDSEVTPTGLHHWIRQLSEVLIWHLDDRCADLSFTNLFISLRFWVLFTCSCGFKNTFTCFYLPPTINLYLENTSFAFAILKHTEKRKWYR